MAGAGFSFGTGFSTSCNSAPAFSFSTAPSLFGSAASSASGGSPLFGTSTTAASGPTSLLGATSNAAASGGSSLFGGASSGPSPFSATQSLFFSSSATAPSFGTASAFKPPSTNPSSTGFSLATASSVSSIPSISATPDPAFISLFPFKKSSSFPSNATSAAAPFSASSTALFGTALQLPPPFGTPPSAFSTSSTSFATPASTSSPYFATPASTSSPSFATPAATSSSPFAMSSAATTAVPSTFSKCATCASAAMTTASTTAQFSFPAAISSSSAQTSSTTAAVAGTSGGSATTTIIPSVFAPQMPSEIRGKTIEAYDGDSGDDAAGNGSEATVLNAVSFQLMQRDETSCKGDPASVEEWRTLIETISTLVLDGGNDVRERVAEKSGRHCDVFSPMVDLSLRCQEFRNRYEEERQRREKLDAGILEHSKEVHTLENEIERLQMAAAERERLQYDEERKRREELDVGNLEHSKEVHMLQNEIERLQMAAAERERMPPLGDWWGIWQREVRRADEEKKRADEERQLVKELTAEIREAERKLGYYKSKYYGLSSQRTTTRGDSSGSRGHFSEHLEDPRE